MLPEKDIGIVMNVYNMAERMNKLIAMGFANDMIEWKEVNRLLNLTGVKDKGLLKRMSKNYVESYQDFKDLYELVQMVCPLIALKRYMDGMEKNLAAIAKSEPNACEFEVHEPAAQMEQPKVEQPKVEQPKADELYDDPALSDSADILEIDLKDIEDEFPLENPRYVYKFDELCKKTSVPSKEKLAELRAKLAQAEAEPVQAEGQLDPMGSEFTPIEDQATTGVRYTADSLESIAREQKEFDTSTKWMDTEAGWDMIHDSINQRFDDLMGKIDADWNDNTGNEITMSMQSREAFIVFAESYLMDHRYSLDDEAHKESIREKIGNAWSRFKSLLKASKKKALPTKEQMELLPVAYQDLCMNSLTVAMRNSMKVSCLPALVLKKHLVQFDLEHLTALCNAYRELKVSARWDKMEFEEWVIWTAFGRALEIALVRGR